MKISVLMRIHGEQPFLMEAISSVLAQKTEADLELWLILDKPSMKVLADLESIIDARVKRFTPISTGYSQPLADLIEKLDSDFLAILDSDDVMVSNRLQIQSDFLLNNPTISVVGSDIILIDSLGQEIGKKSYENDPKLIHKNRYKTLPVAHPATMMRREVISSVGSYRRFYDFAEDYDLWLRVMEVSKMSNIGMYLTKYRVHNSQTNSVHIKSNVMAGVLARRSAKRREKGKNDYSDKTTALKVSVFGHPFIFSEIQWRTLERILWKRVSSSRNNRNYFGIFLFGFFLFLISPISVYRKIRYLK